MNYKLTIRFSVENLQIIHEAGEYVILEHYTKDDPGEEVWMDCFSPMQITELEWEDNYRLYMSSDTSSTQPRIGGYTESVIDKNGVYVFGDTQGFTKQGVLEHVPYLCEVVNQSGNFPLIMFGLAGKIKNSSRKDSGELIPITGQRVPQNQKVEMCIPDMLRLSLASKNTGLKKKVVSAPLLLECNGVSEWTVEYSADYGGFVRVQQNSLDHL